MEENMIFGSDVKLPSLPGLQSDCEEELRMLMKEVDLEFERKHHEILQELYRLRELCRAQRDEIENLKSALLSNEQDGKHKHTEQHKNFCMEEIKKLRDEIFHLKNENTVLKRKARLLDENELIMNSMKRSLNIQQEENNLVQGRLSKLIDEHKTLQDQYERLTSIFEQKEIGRNEDSNIKCGSPVVL
ncbi:centrosomal protein of 63 kDa-like isoform X1 [Stegodyphus dumicola]|uniref:centrosomal protein of 63 kDa-like isoform X1 n=2 Tax=Stegodyphus dumicola TaxID=202533 RepID=UPI0015A772E3|nr:centrosomal protein of 63 kDa-like isoform X1 [Stegodyphus dumicola]